MLLFSCFPETQVMESFKKINIEKFVELSANIPVIDVRSPAEFESGHIPQAVNIPLFNNDERIEVGTKYKKSGRIPAIIDGLKLAGPDMSNKLIQAIKVSKQGRLLIYCWRGGMRSEAMAWLFSLVDIDCRVLDGGYKSYRNFILGEISTKRNIIVLGGLTGSSKTHILNHLKNSGSQVIDMEGLANHKGSAFGALGQKSQPSTEHFANILYDAWRKTNPEIPLMLEDESRNIGTVFMPDPLYENMQAAPAIILIMDVKTRMPRLLEEYTRFPKEDLIAAVKKISKRLGGDLTQEAIAAIESDNFSRAVEITLTYYDKAYLFGLNKKNPEKIIYIRTDTDDVAENAAKVLEATEKIKW